MKGTQLLIALASWWVAGSALPGSGKEQLEAGIVPTTFTPPVRDRPKPEEDGGSR